MCLAMHALKELFFGNQDFTHVDGVAIRGCIYIAR
jgi:hypothetical protein